MTGKEKGSSPFDFGNAFQAVQPDKGQSVNALLERLRCDPAKVMSPDFEVVEGDGGPVQVPELSPEPDARERVSYELRRDDVVQRLEKFASDAGIPFPVAVERAIEAGLMFMGRS